MFLELYEKIKQYLIKNNITKTSEIKEVVDNNIKEVFNEMMPNYDGKFAEMDMLLLKCSANIAQEYNEDVKVIYNMLTNELNIILPSWNSYFDLNNLANALSDVFMDKYYQDKYENKQLDIEVKSFDEVLINTLNRNVESGVNIDSKESLNKFLTWIFDEFFTKRNIDIFTSRNNSRQYVAMKGKDGILNEMMQKTSIQSSLPVAALEDLIKESYINMFVDSSSLEDKKEGKKK